MQSNGAMTGAQQHFYKQNRLKLLRAFCSAVKLGSISAAAERLFLSQPTVSLQIQSLERELDTTLFERHGPKIKPTPEGEVFYRLAQPLLERFNQLEESFKARIGQMVEGELSIAADESAILSILPEFLKVFIALYPDIKLNLLNVTERDGMNLLRADDADFAIGSMVHVLDDMVYQSIGHFSPTLIVPQGHPLALIQSPTIQQISQHSLILPPRYRAIRQEIEAEFEKHAVKLNVTLEADGWEVIKHYVGCGLGISIVTDVGLKDDDEIVRKPLLEYFPQRSYGIVMRKGKILTPQAKRFIDMMDENFFLNHAHPAIQRTA